MLSDLLMSASGSSNSLNIIRPTSFIGPNGSGIYMSANHAKAYDSNINSQNELGLRTVNSWFSIIFRFADPIFLKKLNIAATIFPQGNTTVEIRYKQIPDGPNHILFNQTPSSLIMLGGPFNFTINDEISDIEFYMYCRSNDPTTMYIRDIVGET